jgi:glycosyltransferase involved in cell wall biosynthesis
MGRFYGDSLMKVSIITATYNSEKTLKTCLDSVAQQSASADIEHIIVDGRSSDATLALVNQYPHVSKIVSDKDRGIYHAFNRGVGLATGDLIYFLNSDDSLYDDHVIADVLAEFTSETAYYCGVIFCINEQTKQSYFSETLKDDAINFNPPHQAFFCRRELFDKLGPFNECLTIAADTYFMK